MLSLNHVSYSYASNKKKTVLHDMSYQFNQGVFYAITGESGTGKTTLLSLLGGLDEPTEGDVLFDGLPIKQIGYTKYRRDIISLVFQEYNLIDYMTPLENLQVVNKEAKIETLTELGLDKKMVHRNVMQLSGGQRQRVAIARALSQNTPIILLDEPTGNLDKKTEKDIVNIIKKIAKEKCVIVVTHSPYVASQADIEIKL